MHQRDAMAAFGFVEIRGRHQNRQPARGQMRQRVPELTPRNRIDAGGRLVEQQHPRLRHQRARERELLLHAPAQPSGQPLGKAIHVEHLQVATSAAVDLVAGHAAEVADVADVLADGEVGIEAERLGQIAGVGARLAGRLAEDFSHAGGRFHDAGENLKRRGLSGAVRSDQSEDLARWKGERDTAHRFDVAVALRQVGHADRDGLAAVAAAGDRADGSTNAALIGRSSATRCRRESRRRPACRASRSPRRPRAAA